jgi:methionyl-tRNA synthetase
MTSQLNGPLLITCGLPYANGPCHIGHLRTYIPADIYVRCLRKLGNNPLFVCGSDTHGTPIVINAEQQGTTPEKFAAYYHRYWEDTFTALSVDFNYYGNTDAPTNHFRTQQIVKKLQQDGYIYPLVIRLAYCPECRRFLPDRYVDGVCFFCGTPARGDECDQGCGRHLEPGEIVNPRCKTCGASAEYREERHYFFKLSAFKGFLETYLATLGGTANARNYAREWVANELKDWCITRNLSWGVPFPGTDLVVYVWVDAPIGYISFTEEATSAWEDYWTKDSNIVHFIGGDIIYHHTIFWPALLKAAGYTRPTAIVASGMVKVDGETFSKSRGYVVWVDDDYLDHGFHPDLLRYYLASYTSHTKELNFSWKAFGEKINRELVGSLGNFIYRTLFFTYKNFGRVPEGPVSAAIIEQIAATRDKMVRAIDDYEFKKLVDAAMSLSDYGNSYFQSKELWHLIKSDRIACEREVKNCIQLVKALAVLLEPVMPATMRRVQAQLGLATTRFSDATIEVEPLRLNKPALPFSKIDEKKIAELEALLGRRMAGATKEAPAKEARTSEATIALEDFRKIDLRIARVLDAEPIKKSDTLLRISVQVGNDTRQVVAGIAKDYSPEDIVGTDVIVLVNVRPVTLMGVESHGIVLTAEQEGRAVLVRPSHRMPAGTRIG